MRTRHFVLALLTLQLCSVRAFADEYHYTNLLIGDRASGMGGAYTAVSDDATGLYYNPAGIMYSAGRNLSASVNAYYNLEKKYKNVIGGRGWQRKSSSLLPNYFGVIQPLGKLKIGFSYAVPDAALEDQDQTFTNLELNAAIQPFNPGVFITSYIINFNNEDNTYNVGPSIAAELSDSLSAGITVYFHRRKMQQILNQIIRASNNGFEITNFYLETNETGYRPVFGLMWSPAEKVSIGLAASKTFLTEADRISQFTRQREGIVEIDPNTGGPDSGTESIIPLDQTRENSAKRYPLHVSAGLAYFATESLLLSADFSYFTEGRTTIGNELDPVVNAAVGIEYYVSQKMAIRSGFFRNVSNTPDLVVNRVNQPEHIDLYGVAASVSSFTRNTSVTVGGSASIGSGKAQIVQNGPVQEAEIFGWTIFLSSSFSY